MHRDRNTSGRRATLLAVLAVSLLSYASAQYPSGYPYGNPVKPSPPKRSGPNLAGGLSTYGGNPYQNNRMPHTAMPVRSRSAYFGAPPSGNPFAQKPQVQKPFSNFHRPQPLVSSMDAARISVVSGLWTGGW